MIRIVLFHYSPIDRSIILIRMSYELDQEISDALRALFRASSGSLSWHFPFYYSLLQLHVDCGIAGSVFPGNKSAAALDKFWTIIGVPYDYLVRTVG